MLYWEGISTENDETEDDLDQDGYRSGMVPAEWVLTMDFTEKTINFKVEEFCRVNIDSGG